MYLYQNYDYKHSRAQKFNAKLDAELMQLFLIPELQHPKYEDNNHSQSRWFTAKLNAELLLQANHY